MLSEAAVQQVFGLPERCPGCGDAPVKRLCPCLIGEFVCAAGHTWFHCGRCRRPVRGRPDHGKSAWENLCPVCRKAGTS